MALRKKMASAMRSHWFIGLFLALTSPVAAAPLIGTVRDAESGEGLASATIQVVGTYRGTIANGEGAYALQVPQLPATIRVICIGYRTLEQRIDSTTTRLDFDLPIAPFQMPELVVRPPLASELMRKVIASKAKWMPRIAGYNAEVYTRRTVQRTEEIIELHEIVSTVYWDRERGTREIVTSTRGTRNRKADEYIAALEGMVNLYHDDIEFIESDLMGVTHPDALAHYDFALAGQRRIDDRLVYDLAVKPKNRLHSGFEGTISVLDGEFALLEVDLRPTRATLATAIPLPLIEQLSFAYRQQFRAFEGLWLPVDYRLAVEVEIGMIGLQFPLIGMQQVTRFADYEVLADPVQKSVAPNEVLPAIAFIDADTLAKQHHTALLDSVFAHAKPMRVDSAAVAADTAFTRFADPVPFTAREAVALDTISAQFTVDKALRPSGFLTRFMDFEEENGEQKGATIKVGTNGTQVEPGKGRRLISGIRAAARFNRVEEAQLGLKLSRPGPAHTTLGGSAGFSSGLRRWSFDLSAQRGWDLPSGHLWFNAGYHEGGGSHYESDTYAVLFNSLQALLGEDDYFDYYWVDGFGADLSYAPGAFAAKARLGWRAEKHSSLASTTDFDMLGRKPMRLNPTVDEGSMRRMELEVEIGGEYTPFGVEPNRRLELSLEHSAEWMGSDFDFTKFHFAADWHQPTFLRRRWIPNALDIRVVGGTHRGRLPVQRFGALDVAMGPLSPYGALRGASGHPYVGESYLGAMVEHNFRTAPFEMLGLWPLVQRGFGLLVHGGYGQTWIDADRRAGMALVPRWTKTPHKEFGGSLFLYHIARIDVTRRIDPAAWSIGISMTRFAFE